MLRHMPKTRKTAHPERRVKIFTNGRNRAVRIPREFEFRGTEAIMRKEGKRLVIEPLAPKSLLEVLTTLRPLEDEFPAIPDRPAEPVKM